MKTQQNIANQVTAQNDQFDSTRPHGVYDTIRVQDLISSDSLSSAMTSSGIPEISFSGSISNIKSSIEYPIRCIIDTGAGYNYFPLPKNHAFDTVACRPHEVTFANKYWLTIDRELKLLLTIIASPSGVSFTYLITAFPLEVSSIQRHELILGRATLEVL